MRDRPAEALPVIMKELKQMVTKGVWHGVHTKHLTSKQRVAIIRSSMFLKDKWLPSGTFEKFKARLVAGGDQQDKSLYEDLSSPTAATSSVFAVAAIAAAEGRIVVATDIGGAFLNASMEPTGVKVHMRLDPAMAKMLVKIAPEYSPFLEPSGSMVVELDKALYGCVEASLLWFKDLRSKLVAHGFVANPYDQCVFNKFDEVTGTQMTVVLHVDDLMVTSTSQGQLDDFHTYLNSVYPETSSKQGPIVSYLGMSFDLLHDPRRSTRHDGQLRSRHSSDRAAARSLPSPVPRLVHYSTCAKMRREPLRNSGSSSTLPSRRCSTLPRG
jgi:hypothetical protein